MSFVSEIGTLETLRDRAALVELQGVNFLRKDGTFTRGDFNTVHRAEFAFVDGSKIVVPRSEMQRPGFNELKFSLRPARDDA